MRTTASGSIGNSNNTVKCIVMIGGCLGGRPRRRYGGVKAYKSFGVECPLFLGGADMHSFPIGFSAHSEGRSSPGALLLAPKCSRRELLDS